MSDNGDVLGAGGGTGSSSRGGQGLSSSEMAREMSSIRLVLEQQSEYLRAMGDYLKRMDDRQVTADSSMKSISPVPARSASAWMALWESANDHIEPQIERLKSSLDALLVFIGLFSAIVTAFFVESSKGLKRDEAAKTNELLANMTDIILAINGAQFANMRLPYAESFTPESVVVRLNAYWSLALVSSISIAAISVVCRSFLMAVIQAQSRNACQGLTEIFMKWRDAERILKPTIELVPQFMTVPVLLFISGLLDNIYSLDRQSNPRPVPILLAFGLSSVLTLVMILVLTFFLLHGIIHPLTSPFQSVFSRLLVPGTPKDGAETTVYDDPDGSSSVSTLKDDELRTFHSILRMTRSDALLDQGSAPLSNLLSREAVEEDLKSLIYLLSPEASMRSNMAAIEIINNHMDVWCDHVVCANADLQTDWRTLRYPLICQLLEALIGLAHRLGKSKGYHSLFNSDVVSAICHIMMLFFLDSRSVSRAPGWIYVLQPTFQLLWLPNLLVRETSRSLPNTILLGIRIICGRADVAIQYNMLKDHINFDKWNRAFPSSIPKETQHDLDWGLQTSLFPTVFDTWISLLRHTDHSFFVSQDDINMFMKTTLQYHFRYLGAPKGLVSLTINLCQISGSTSPDHGALYSLKAAVLRILYSELYEAREHLPNIEGRSCIQLADTLGSTMREVNTFQNTQYGKTYKATEHWVNVAMKLAVLLSKAIPHVPRMTRSLSGIRAEIQRFLCYDSLWPLSSVEIYETLEMAISLWPNLTLPAKALETSIAKTFLPLPEGWERRFVEEYETVLPPYQDLNNNPRYQRYPGAAEDYGKGFSLYIAKTRPFFIHHNTRTITWEFPGSIEATGLITRRQPEGSSSNSFVTTSSSHSDKDTFRLRQDLPSVFVEDSPKLPVQTIISPLVHPPIDYDMV